MKTSSNASQLTQAVFKIKVLLTQYSSIELYYIKMSEIKDHL